MEPMQQAAQLVMMNGGQGRVFNTDEGIDVDLGVCYVKIRDGVLLVDEHTVDEETVAQILRHGIRSVIPPVGEWVSVDPDTLPDTSTEEFPLPEVSLETVLGSLPEDPGVLL